MDEWMDICIDEGYVKFFLTSLGKPDEIVKQAHENGIKVYHDVHNASLAERAVGAGVDGLNLLNTDMGGQTGSIPAKEFIESVLKMDLNVPLVCAGGVGGASLIIFRPNTHILNTFLSHTTSFMSFTRPKFTFPSHFLSQITPLPIQMKQVLLQH